MSHEPKSGVSRRRLFELSGGAAALAAAASTSDARALPAPEPIERKVTATEGTNICATVSPDGRQIAFDIYGVLWLLPAEGGAAKRLTENEYEIAQPDWSPDGRQLMFQSYRDGNFHIWRIDVDGSNLTQLTRGTYDHREPRYSPDGKRIAFSSDSGGGYGVYVMDLATGAKTQVPTGSGDAFEPSWSPDGKKIVLAIDKFRIVEVELATGAMRTIAQIKASADRFTAGALASPAYTKDGAQVIYSLIEGGKAELRDGAGRVVVAGEDAFPFRVSWLDADTYLYTSDGLIKRRKLSGGVVATVPFTATVPVKTPRYRKRTRDFDTQGRRPVVGIGAPALSPDGMSVAFRALNDIYLLKLGERARPLFRDTSYKVDPCWSADGKLLAYSCDRGGTLDIWIRDMATGHDRQLTHFKEAAVSPAWSRDGRSIAFLSQAGGLHVADVATGATHRLYGDLWEPGKPSWSPDGKTIALAAFKPYSGRVREGLSEILTVDVESGKGVYQPFLPNKSLGTRGDDGPVWSPDGKSLAVVFASRLWTIPVDASGKITGAPKALNEEVTDAPTWSGDSSKLLYLSAGKLRMIPASGGPARNIPHGLTWTLARPRGKVVIQAGRLWDGLSPEVRRDVDVVVEGDRITAIVPRGAGPKDARIIDATTRMVMPGMVDMHTHRQMQGYGYGDRDGRLWLSLGVTATRSPGGPAYHTVEDQEAIAAGARIGPRYYATGEAIDGSRIFYNFMRPVTEPGQMALELQRVEALSYDLIKTYVRLSPEHQKEVIDWAHAHNLHVTSHYHYPALSYGIDGMEHLGATSRTGYSRTISALGQVYQDVNVAFVAAGSARTPTLFVAQAMLPDDRSLLEDRRIRALYPPWEYAKLKGRTEQLATQDRSSMLANLARQVAEVKRTIEAGGIIISGTDSPIDFNAVSFHMNLRGMVKYGLTPYQALVTATRAAGEYLDQPIGVIRVGAFADITIVNGDPLVKIEDAANVVTVLAGGQVFSVDDLLGPFKAPTTVAMAGPSRSFTCEAEPEYWWHHPDWLEGARTSCCDGACSLQGAFRV